MSKPFLQKTLKQKSYQFIMLFGAVSMFGDMTYEGGRSIIGPYLAVLGASAATVGFIGGLGELIGYSLRLVSGYLTDKTRAYWLITFIGYGLLVSIPLLAFTNQWQLAAVLVVLERFGKAVRSPAKDTMLSHAAKNVGTGFGFGIHEALDQVGGIIGPLIFSVVFFLGGDYKLGFNFLWIPAILTIFFLLIARLKVPNPESLEEVRHRHAADTLPSGKMPALFWWYMTFAFLSVGGFAHFQVIAYHFKTQSVLTNTQIPLFYGIAMGVDAIAALLVGKAYDKKGLRMLVMIPLLSIPIPFLAFTHSFSNALISVLIWGAVMALHETIMRAAIADIIPIQRRGFAYGIFNAAYGLAWFGGSWLMGFLYDTGIEGIGWFVTGIEGLALIAFFGLNRKLRLK